MLNLFVDMGYRVGLKFLHVHANERLPGILFSSSGSVLGDTYICLHLCYIYVFMGIYDTELSYVIMQAESAS